MAALVDRGAAVRPQGIAKAATGIGGFDEIADGGLPAGRATLVCGGPGCGKTLFGATFLVNGATRFGEPGVFVSFEERHSDLVKNVASLGYDLEDLIAHRLLAIDHVAVERSEIEETGDYDLEALFIRIGYAIDRIGAKRVVLDTIETLFAGLSNEAILRAELRRLFAFLKDRGVSVIITGERGDGQLTRQGLEEYISDCVVLLDHRVYNQVSTRRLRIVKYRGTNHGTNEYPFLIDDLGISVLPVTVAGLDHAANDERISTGIAELDDMLGGLGFFRGSSVLVSGTSGSGKSSVAVHFADAACRRGERALFFAFEESPAQIARNMRSIGLDLQRWSANDRMRFVASRPSLYGLEMHLTHMHREIELFQPQLVVIDPISSLTETGAGNEVQAMLLRLIDFLKSHNITAIFTALTYDGHAEARSDLHVSSLMDSWLLLANRERNGEYNRELYLLKSRGMAHSNQLREFLLTDHGIRLLYPYVGPSGVLTGSARLAQEASESAAVRAKRQDIERREREIQRRRRQLEAQIEVLRAEIDGNADELSRVIDEARQREVALDADRTAMAASRRAAAPLANGGQGAAD